MKKQESPGFSRGEQVNDWTIREQPAAWWRGRRIDGMTAYHVLVHGPEQGQRLALVDFCYGSSRVVDLAEVEVEVVVTREATR